MTILEAAQAVVDAAVGTPTGVLVPTHLLDQLAQAVDQADALADLREVGA